MPQAPKERERFRTRLALTRRQPQNDVALAWASEGRYES